MAASISQGRVETLALAQDVTVARPDIASG
jgi:hypothetical protein